MVIGFLSFMGGHTCESVRHLNMELMSVSAIAFPKFVGFIRGLFFKAVLNLLFRSRKELVIVLVRKSAKRYILILERLYFMLRSVISSSNNPI